MLSEARELVRKMHNVEDVLKKVKEPKKLRVKLDVNGKLIPIYFDTYEDKELFIDLMCDYFEDLDFRDANGDRVNPIYD